MNGIEAAPKSLVILIAASLPKVHGCGQGFIQRESFWVGGGELQEMGVALYTFPYSCSKLWGEASPPPSGVSRIVGIPGHLYTKLAQW